MDRLSSCENMADAKMSDIKKDSPYRVCPFLYDELHFKGSMSPKTCLLWLRYLAWAVVRLND